MSVLAAVGNSGSHPGVVEFTAVFVYTPALSGVALLGMVVTFDVTSGHEHWKRENPQLTYTECCSRAQSPWRTPVMLMPNPLY